MEEALMQLTKSIITLLGLFITYKVIPILREKIKKDNLDNIYFWVDIAVNAAEQIYSKSGLGNEKKKYVLKFLQEKDLDIDEKDLDILIEAAVAEINRIKNATK